MKKETVFVTGNINKLKEFEEILGIQLLQKNLDLDEIQSLDSDEVVIKKAQAAYEKIIKPLVVEDSSLSLNVWKGLPGALIVWFTNKTIGVEGLLKMLENESNREAQVKISIGYCDENGPKVFSAVTDGQITREQRGENGWEWDRIFQPNGFDKTYAEMTPKEKNSVSTRKEALEKLRKFLAP